MRLLTISILVFFSSAIFAQNYKWTQQNSGDTIYLRDVYFTDNQNGWIVGNKGVILNTTDGGQNWTTQTSGVSELLRAVYFINADTGWAVGGSLEKALIKTTDGGLNWQSIAPNYSGSKQMYDIAFFDANTGWLVAFDSIYRTTDGGDNWESEAYVTTVEVPVARAIAVTSDTTAYIAGSRKKNSSTRQAEVFYRRPENFPLLWGTSGFDPSVSDDHFMSIEFINSDIGFAGGQRGQLYKKTGLEGGGPWYLNFELSENQMIHSISFPNESDGMFNTSIQISDVTYALIYHTSDAGENWSASPDTIPDFLLATLYAPDTANAWIVGVGGKIYKGAYSPAGINKMSLNIDVNIYPNPSTNLINVKMHSASNEVVSYSLSDMTGRIVEKGQWNLRSSDSRFTLNISDIMKGVYLLKLSTDEGQSTFRILKN